MAVWSSLRSTVGKWAGSFSKNAVGNKRFMSGGHDDHHRVMAITPSRFQWKKTKDLLHFYAMIGIIPLGLLVFYANVYIGPAKLAPVPEDYTPKYWEYYKHPITRFMAQHFFTSPQQEYEKYLHQLYEEDEKAKIKALQKRIKALMAERNDYQAYYYIPVEGKYHRIVRKQTEEMAEYAGVQPRITGPEALRDYNSSGELK